MLDEQYLRQDVPSGLKNDPGSEVNPNCRLELSELNNGVQRDTLMAQSSVANDADDADQDVGRKYIDKIFVIDHHFALN